MTYGTRHMDKKAHPKSDESSQAVPAAPSQDPHEDTAAPAASAQPAASEPPKEKRGIQVLISFSSEQTETLIREDLLYRLFSRFGSVLDCVVKGHSSSPNYHPYHHGGGGHHGDVGTRDAAAPAQSGYGFVIFEHEEDAQRCLEHFQPPAAAEAAAASGDAAQTTDASATAVTPTVTPTVRLTDELTGLSVACELRIAKPRAPAHGHVAHRHGRRGPSGFGNGSGNVSRSTSTSPRAQRPTSGNLTGHLHGLAPDATAGSGGAHLYASNAAVYNTPPHGGSSGAVPMYGQPQQLLMMQGFMQYTGSEFYSPSPSISRTQSIQSNYSSRSTSPRLSMSNGHNAGSSVGTPQQQAAYGGTGSPRTGSPRLSGMMHMGNVVYHTPQHAPGSAPGSGGGVYMMTPPSAYVQSISSLNSSRSTSPRLAPYSGNASGGGPGGAVYVSPAPYYPEGAYLQSLAAPVMAPQAAYGSVSAQNAPQTSQLQYSSPRASPPTVPHSGGSSHAASHAGGGHSSGLPSILAANIPAELQGSVSLAHQQHHQSQSQHFDQSHGHVGYGYAQAGYASYDNAAQAQQSAPQGHSVYIDSGAGANGAGSAAGGAYYVPMMPPLPPPLPMPMPMSVPMHLPPPHSMNAGPPPMQPLPAPFVGSSGYSQQSTGGYYDAAPAPQHPSHQSHQSSPRYHPGNPGQ